MLLPAFSPCTSSQLAMTRFPATFGSPPASPPQLPTQALASPATFETVQAPITPPTAFARLPTPPQAHLLKSPLPHVQSSATFRLRVCRMGSDSSARERIVRRVGLPSVVNKRRRASDDVLGRDKGDGGAEDKEKGNTEPFRPQTPKRARIAPQVLPMGLDRSDYHNLYRNGEFCDDKADPDDVLTESDGEKWTEAEDQILTELVLEKLKLSKADWQDCARSLGRDQHSLGRRWRKLMLNDYVGLKRFRRTGLDGSWR